MEALVCFWELVVAETAVAVLGWDPSSDWVIDVGDGDNADEDEISEEDDNDDDDHHAFPIKMCDPSMYRLGIMKEYPFRLDKVVSGSSTVIVMESSDVTLAGRR